MNVRFSDNFENVILSMDDKYYLIRYKYNLKLFQRRQRLKKDVCVAQTRLNFSGADTTSIMIRMKMALGDLDYMAGIWKMFCLRGMSL